MRQGDGDLSAATRFGHGRASIKFSRVVNDKCARESEARIIGTLIYVRANNRAVLYIRKIISACRIRGRQYREVVSSEIPIKFDIASRRYACKRTSDAVPRRGQTARRDETVPRAGETRTEPSRRLRYSRPRATGAIRHAARSVSVKATRSRKRRYYRTVVHVPGPRGTMRRTYTSGRSGIRDLRYT